MHFFGELRSSDARLNRSVAQGTAKQKSDQIFHTNCLVSLPALDLSVISAFGAQRLRLVLPRSLSRVWLSILPFEELSDYYVPSISVPRH